MPVNAGIYSQIQSPEPVSRLDSLARAYKLQDMQQGAQMNALKMDEYQRGVQRQNRLQQLLSGADEAGAPDALLKGGFLQESTALRKSKAENAQSDAKTKETLVATALKRLEAAGQAFGYVKDNPTPEAAQQAVSYLMENGIWDQPTAQAALARVQENPTPEAIRALATQAYQSALSAKDQLPKYETRNLGGRSLVNAINPVTGQVTEAASNAITQSADNAASQATSRANNAATIAQSERTSLRADARSREATSAAMSKPFEVTGPDGQPVLVQQDKKGNIVPVEGYSPKGGTGKPLPAGVVKQITEARDNAVTMDRLNSSFKDNFAGKGVFGLGADKQLAASGNFGMDGAAVDWWKNYRKQAELVERHALFGAALTPTEQESWRSADIGPGMNAGVVKKNLETRAALTKKMFENAQADQIDAGHAPSRINALGLRAQFSDGHPPEIGDLLKKYGK